MSIVYLAKLTQYVPFIASIQRATHYKYV